MLEAGRGRGNRGSPARVRTVSRPSGPAAMSRAGTGRGSTKGAASGGAPRLIAPSHQRVPGPEEARRTARSAESPLASSLLHISLRRDLRGGQPDHTVCECKHEELGSGVELQLAHDVRAVRVDGSDLHIL